MNPWTSMTLMAALRRSLPHTLACLSLLAGLMVLGACETTEGFGKDVKDLGGSIEDSAAKNK